MAANPPLNSKDKISKSTKESRRKDRLSALPDSLLLHILSSLTTKQVMRTCVLSKRWRFLWTDSSSLVLQETSGDVYRSGGFVYSLARILALCTGTHLKKLSIHFMYQHYFAASVNVWVEFAIRTRIKDFTLLLVTNTNEFYPLPQTLYSNSSLTDLTIGCCVIAPRGSVTWGALKNLRIHNVGLDELVFEKLMLGCPVLELLQLTTCWGHGRLKVSSPNLTTLVIVGWTSYPYDYCLMISAPYLRVLSVSDEWPTRSFVVGDFWLSLVTAKVDYKFAFDAANFVHVDHMLLPTVKRSLESFSSVNELELGPWCIQVLSWLEKKSLHLSPSTRLCLTLNTWRHKSSIGGILNILKSSPNLETLVIKGTNYENHLNFGSQLQDDSSDLVLCALKTVNISGFSEAGLSGEPMLSLVQLLLKSATNLEKIVIDAKALTSYSSTTHHHVEFSEISLKLLGFPRSSPKAVVMIR